MHSRLKLINWVRELHEGQLIKDTDSAYFDHLLAVANRVAATGPFNYEIGLCHDLLDKTSVKQPELMAQLQGFGYASNEAAHISNCVAELTRHFTKADNPLPKKMRKALEDERLLYISPDAQTVKYADFLDNAEWMMLHDRHHARDYLQSKLALLAEMMDGDDGLRNEVMDAIKNLLAKL